MAMQALFVESITAGLALAGAVLLLAHLADRIGNRIWPQGTQA